MGLILGLLLSWGTLAYAKPCTADLKFVGQTMGPPRVLMTQRLRVVEKIDKGHEGLKVFEVIESGEGKLVGHVTISAKRKQSAKILSLGIKKPSRGNEYGPEAAAAVIDEVFRVYDVDRFESSISPNNLESISAHIKLGFRKDGASDSLFVLTPDDFSEQARKKYLKNPN